MTDFLKMSRTILESLCKKPFCKRYPFKPAKLFEKTRGHVTNDASKCILCTLCEKKCPTGAIQVDREKRKWTINYFKCILCNECVTNCPPKSLLMENQHASPANKKTTVTITIKPKI